MNKKVILITGGAKGIGREIVSFFASKNYNIVFTYNTSYELSKKIVNEIKEKYQIEINNIKCDLCQEEDIINLYNFVKNKYSKIDILVNNAAVSMDSHFLDKTKEEFMKVLETNLVGTFLMIKYFDELVNGYIFNISSTDSIDTGSIYNIDYSASKAGINNLTKIISLYSKNKIISICPNWVNTESVMEMNPEYLENELKRVGQKKLINPSMISKTIYDLVISDVKTGEIIRIDGDIDE